MRRIRSGLLVCVLAGVLLPVSGFADTTYKSGSKGIDGALEPTEDLVIDMSTKPDGIWEYTRVNIPEGVTVSFIPNENNTPVRWLVQEDVVIAGTVSVGGEHASDTVAGTGGPGGYPGGVGGQDALGGLPGEGFGPGAPKANTFVDYADGRDASHANIGLARDNAGGFLPGDTYGNIFLLPLRGGSGGSGEYAGSENLTGGYIGMAGGGGGGAILIAANESITLAGSIVADGGRGGSGNSSQEGGYGSGGGIRLVAPVLDLDGILSAYGEYFSQTYYGSGYIRLEGAGDIVCELRSNAVSSSAVPGITILPAHFNPVLAVTSIAGVMVPAIPLGELETADVDIPATTSNPVDVVVDCANLAPGTDVAVRVTPEFGASQTYSASNTGTYESSTATVSVDLPTGGGVIMAMATSTLVDSAKSDDTELSLLETGLAPNGERFATARVVATPGGKQKIEYVTPSGAVFAHPVEEE